MIYLNNEYLNYVNCDIVGTIASCFDQEGRIFRKENI